VRIPSVPSTKREGHLRVEGGRHRANRDRLKRAIFPYTALAAFYAAADKMPEAKAALGEAMKLNPRLSVAWFHERTPSLIDSPPGFREALIKAGLPEE
jgi:hypothetical protein